MSMSQEEIEALMNGLDIEDDNSDSSEETTNVKVNTQEIEELLSQTEDYKDDIKLEESKTNELVDFSDNKDESDESLVDNDEIEKLLNEIESTNSDEEDYSKSFDDLEPVGKIKEEKNNVKKEDNSFNQLNRSEDDIVKDWTSNKINEGVFPFPAEKDTKVVNQLTQVANDSEEKVSQIFDVLSLTLDNNNEIRNHIKAMEAFVTSQSNLLQSLNNKFPNINVFNDHLNNATNVSTSLNSLKILINDEDSEIFQAMELMQFNDINRQKIERVMSVIRKLSSYLNNLFEDDGNSKDIAVAKHIHGDNTDDLIGDDLDKLIAEFSNNK